MEGRRKSTLERDRTKDVYLRAKSGTLVGEL
jgi:hypothetical protein